MTETANHPGEASTGLSPARAQALGERAGACLGASFVLGMVGIGCYMSEGGYPVLGVAFLVLASFMLGAYSHIEEQVSGESFLIRTGRYLRLDPRQAATPYRTHIPSWVYLASIACISAACLSMVADLVSPLMAAALVAMGAYAPQALAWMAIRQRKVRP